MTDLKFLTLLAKDYPNIRAASAEIINLRAILALPKGTEYFFSDIHGEYEAFLHMLKSASGIIKNKMDITLGKRVSVLRCFVAVFVICLYLLIRGLSSYILQYTIYF